MKRDREGNANLVNSNVSRAVRLGGNLNNGANDGLSIFNGNNAVSNGNSNYGGALYIQSSENQAHDRPASK